MKTPIEIRDDDNDQGAALLERVMRIGLCTVLLMLSGLNTGIAEGGVTTIQNPMLRGDEDSGFAKLESYLRRNQLHGLLLALYQDELLRQEDSQERARLANRLSQLYGWSLNNRSDNFEEISSAWDGLARDFPDSIDSRAYVQVAFGHYRRARDEFGKWLREGGDASRRAAVHQQFSELVTRAGRLIEKENPATGTAPDNEDSQSGTERQELVLGVDESSIDPDQENMPQVKTPLSNVAVQARYVLAWSLYYRAMTSSEPARRTEDLNNAVKLFQELLQIPEGTGLTELRPQWFSLDSDWNCRLLTGLGMASQALGQTGESALCFALLGEPRVPATIRHFRDVYQFQSMAFAGQLSEANEFLQTIATTGDRNVDHSDLWKAAAITGYGAWVHQDLDAAYQSIALTGMRNLVLKNEWSTIDSLLDGSSRELFGEDFFANWLEGYRSLRLAQAGHPNQIAMAVVRLRTAVEQTSQLVKFSSSEKQFELRARCRYHLGLALYFDQQLPASVEQFRQAVAVLNHSDRQVAEHGLWMQCQALERIAGDDAGSQVALAASLKEFLQRYPHSPRVGDVLFLQTVQQVRNQQPAEAIRSLDSIPPDDAYYIRGRLELCRMAHQEWSQRDRADVRLDESRTDWGQTVIDSASDVIRLSKESPQMVSAAQQVRICLLAADVLLHAASPDREGTEQWLSRAVQLVPPDGMGKELQADWCYLDMEIGKVSSDEARQRAAADWLVKNSVHPEHRRAAWLALAELSEVRFDRERDALSNHAAHERLLEVIGLYANAVAVEPQSADMPQASIEALARIAPLQQRSGQTQASYESYQRLVQFDSENLIWLAGLAQTATDLEKWSTAAELWRRIAAAVPAGNNTWLESKYGVVRCLVELDRESALQVLQQTRLLVPEMPEPWASKFSQLAARVETEIEFNRSGR